MMLISPIKIFVNLFLLTSIFKKFFINSFLLTEKFPFTKILSTNNVFVITENRIRIYDIDLSTIKGQYDFESNEKIESEDDAQFVYIDEFEDGTSIAFVKKKIFVFSDTANYLGKLDITDYLDSIPTFQYYYDLVAYECNNQNYYFTVSYIISPNIIIKYFKFTRNGGSSLSAATKLSEYSGKPKTSQNYDGEAKSNGISCHKIYKNDIQALICFYEMASPFGVSVSYYSISTTNIQELSWGRDFTTNQQGSIIKSVLSPDYKKALICYTRYFYDGICVVYDIDLNKFSDETKYFNECRGKGTGIKVYYFQKRNEYMFVCQNNRKGFNIVLYDSNFEAIVPNSGNNKTEPYYEFGGRCYNLFTFDIIYLESVDDYILINDCNMGDDKGYISGNINLDRLSEPGNNYPSDQPINLVYDGPKTLVHPNTNTHTEAITHRETDAITHRETDAITHRETDAITHRMTDAITHRETDAITHRETDAITHRMTDAITYRETDAITNIPTQGNTEPNANAENRNKTYIVESIDKTKDEVINDLDSIIQDKDPEKSYKINGDTFSVFIQPVDEHAEDSSVNIYFTECEQKLKQKYPEKKFRILQINMQNNNKNCLTDQVEYKIYDELGQEMDLSLCSDVDITIEYEIKNASLLNLEQISSFKEQGIDVFDLKHDFFNDICYSYSDSDSDSDMILSDRVTDIYQNYSLCGEECEYESFDVEKLTATCSCKVKQETSTEIEEGNFQTYVVSAFLESNFGVAKCYNLVFSLEGKLKNAGFLVFGTMIISHIPIYIYYIIKGVNPLVKYLNREMDKKGYSINNNKYNKSPKKEETAQSFKNSQENPPKKNVNYSYSSNTVMKFNKLQKKKEINVNFNDNDIDNQFTPKKDKNNNDNINTIANDLKENKRKHRGKLMKEKKRKKLKKKDLISKDDDNPSIDKDKNVENDYIQYSKRMRKSHKLLLRNNGYLNGMDTKINTPVKLSKNGGKSTKNVQKYYARKNNLMKEIDSGDLLTYDKEFRNKLKKKKSSMDNNQNIVTTSVSTKSEHFGRRKRRLKTEYPLILINANNIKGENDNDDPLKSNYIINNFNFNEAVLYDKRTFCRIFYIYLISKENVLNIILFNPPLELKPIRIGVFIFSFACDFALNALFYLSDNISDKYHYDGQFRELFAVINNMAISIVSALVSFFLLLFFQSLTQSSGKIEDLFRTQEILLKNDKNYIVTDYTKKQIHVEIHKIMICLKIKLIFFFILEFIFMLFFFYYATAFCQVYQSTQTSWLLDCLSSYGISLIATIIFSFICALFYIISIKCKIKVLYKIITFIYSFS